MAPAYILAVTREGRLIVANGTNKRLLGVRRDCWSSAPEMERLNILGILTTMVLLMILISLIRKVR